MPAASPASSQVPLDRMTVVPEDSVRKMSLNLEKVSVVGSIKRMLNESDRDGDGRLSVAEIIAVVERGGAERKEKDEAKKTSRKLLKALLFVCAAMLLLVGSMFGLTWWTVVENTQTFSRSAEDGSGGAKK